MHEAGEESFHAAHGATDCGEFHRNGEEWKYGRGEDVTAYIGAPREAADDGLQAERSEEDHDVGEWPDENFAPD